MCVLTYYDIWVHLYGHFDKKMRYPCAVRRRPFYPMPTFFPSNGNFFFAGQHITRCTCVDVLKTNVNKCFHLAHRLHFTRQHLFTWVCTSHATCSHLFAFVCPSIFLICAICGTLCAWITPAGQVMHITCHKNTR